MASGSPSLSDRAGIIRVPFAKLVERLSAVLTRAGFDADDARLCARLFADTTRDGIYTHGVRRFPRLMAMVRNGAVQPKARPVCISSSGALERWDGQSGPGNLNAWHSMERAIELARQHGIGCVGLANTNHWMRGGTYGWQAAEAGMIGICWTNTMPNVPPWGARDSRIGNNPLIVAVPRPNGHIVLDMAMSQFS